MLWEHFREVTKMMMDYRNHGILIDTLYTL